MTLFEEGKKKEKIKADDEMMSFQDLLRLLSLHSFSFLSTSFGRDSGKERDQIEGKGVKSQIFEPGSDDIK